MIPVMESVAIWRDFILYAVISVILWYTYRLMLAPLFSPLRKIPGCPFRPIVGNMVEARKSEAMTNCIRWMKKYKSKIIRFYYFGGEERLLVADPDIFRQVLVTNSRNYRRYGTLRLLSEVIGSDPLFSLSGEPHHIMRKIANPAFALSVLYDMIPVFAERAEALSSSWITKLKEAGGKHVDVELHQSLQRLTLDVICKCGFDYNVNCIENPGSENEKRLREVVSGVQFGFLDFLPFSSKLPLPSKKKIWRDIEFTKEFTEKIIEQSKSSNSTKRDLLTLLSTACDTEGTHLSRRELIGQVFGFLIAGFETTSVALTWTLLQLSQYPELQTRARQEVMSIIKEKEDSDITHEDLDKMKYLTCVIKESQRLFPAVVTLFRQALADDNFQGYHIPKGTIVGLHIGALHRLNWENPDQYNPDRFLNPNDIENKSFLPFGFGPYMCIGNKFSMMEMKTVLSILLRKFTFDTSPGYKFRRVQGAVMRPSPPAVIRISRYV